MSMSEFMKSKGLCVEYYNYVYINTSTQYRYRSNYPFADVSYTDIFDLYRRGVINGVEDKIFHPYGTLTREQAAVIVRNLARTIGLDTAAAAHAYADDAAISDWAKTGVAFVTDRGLMGGVGGNRFAPKDTLSHEQAYIIMDRLLTLAERQGGRAEIR